MIDDTQSESETSQSDSQSEEIDFVFCPGLRAGSQLIFTTKDDQLFRKCSKYKTGYYYRCRIQSCGARVFHVNGKCYLKAAHDHENEQRAEYDEILVKTQIKDACKAVSSLSSASDHVSQIFQRVVRE